MKEFYLCCIVILCFVLSVTAKDIVVFDECSYLHKDKNQSNSYYTDEGNACCLCGKGTYWNGDCSSTEKMYETRCEPCVYNDKIKTFVDFEPHKRTICEVEQHCPVGFISVGGSALEEHRCECPVGFKKIKIYSSYYVCKREDVIVETTTPNSKAVVKTNETTATIENQSKKDKLDVAITPKNNEIDQKIVDTDKPEVANTPKNNEIDQKIVDTVSPKVNVTHVPSNTTIYISNEDENQRDNMPTNVRVVISFFVGILAIIILIACRVRKKIRTYFMQFLELIGVIHCPPRPRAMRHNIIIQDPQGSSSRHDDTISLTAHSQYGEVNNSVETAEPSEVRSLLSQSANTGPDDPSVSDIREPNEIQTQSTNNGSDDPSDHNFYLSEEVEIVSEHIRINIDDVEAGQQQDVAQDENSDTLTSVLVVETPESYRKLELQKNMAGPIDSDNRNGVVREASDNLGTTVDASNQQQLGTDFALQASSLTQQDDPRISLDHKKFRLIAAMNAADIITQPDRMSIGHFLIPNDVELDSIIKSYIGDGHMEVSRRVFIRGFQLKPNLSLYELRDEAERLKLGYLEDKFKEQIEQLEIVLAQEE